MAVKKGWTGRVFEDFEVGDVLLHPLGRTVTQTDNIIGDIDGLQDASARARRLGFDGKLAIHPHQVETINAAFMPDRNEVMRAERVVAASDASSSGVARVDGTMVDQPVLERAAAHLPRGLA